MVRLENIKVAIEGTVNIDFKIYCKAHGNQLCEVDSIVDNEGKVVYITCPNCNAEKIILSKTIEKLETEIENLKGRS